MSKKVFSNKRRAFLIGAAMTSAGALFTVAGCNPGRGLQQASGSRSAGNGAGQELSVWITIRPDNKVVLKIPQAEIGQGGLTSISQFLAEELDVDWADVIPEFYDPSVNVAKNNVYVYAATLGSAGISNLMEPARIAAAQIRSMMVRAAAVRWKHPVDTLDTELGHVRHKASGQSISYADLVGDAVKLPVPDPHSVKLKSPDKWRYIGKSVPRVDIPSKVDGSAKYGIDLHFPGLKYAAIKQSPVFGGRLKSFDATEAKKHAGVIDVVSVKAGPSGLNDPTPSWGIDYGMDDAVAVIADDWWTAKTVLESLHVEWDTGSHVNANSKDIAEEFQRALAHPGAGMKVVREEGNFDAAFDKAHRHFEAVYSVPFAEHATMEPINCTAIVRDDGVEVWAASQYPDEALRIAASAANVPLGKARFHPELGGCGFGRRIVSDYVSQAVQIARAVKGTPVKLLWTREEMIRRSYYPPYTLSKFRAGIDEQGGLVAWESVSVGGRAPDQSYGTARLPQLVPNLRISYEMRDTPPPFGWKRGVAFSQHTWMNQYFLNEIARLSGKDPVEFQLALLRPDELPKNMEKRELALERIIALRRVLEKLKETVEWPIKPSPGKGRGIAVHDQSYWPEYSASAAAAMVEVSMQKQRLKVERVVVVVDAGRVVNPDNAVAQIQGGVAFGLTDFLYSEISLADGKVIQSNFHDYPILRMASMPKVEVHFMASEGRSHGIGETPVPLVIAAVASAVADAGGPPIRSLPVVAHGIEVV